MRHDCNLKSGKFARGSQNCKTNTQEVDFFKLTSGLGLTKYVSGRLSICGKSISYLYDKIDLKHNCTGMGPGRHSAATCPQP